MSWLLFIGLSLLAFAIYWQVRISYYATVAINHDQTFAVKNGDRLKCSINVRIHGDLAYMLSLVIPRLESQEPTIRKEADAILRAIVNRWALQFESAAEVVIKDAYDSLARALDAGIYSPNFILISAEVIGIEVVKLAEKPAEEEAPELSPVEAIRNKHTLVVKQIEAIQQSEVEIAEKHPDVINDPAVQEHLALMFDLDKREATLRDAPLGEKKKALKRLIDRRNRRA